ncbi:recombinase family protein [Methylocella sp.]|uniref:recombinase family protein n=1 Tax=Methylocella sp. TaxID=1978226 RepID=UPI0035B0F210
MNQTILYARCSTLDQTVAIQRQQAEAAGFILDEVIEDEGVSGVNTLFADRPGGKRALDKLRKGDTLVVRWIDRLGRNYEDVTGTLRAMLAKGVIVKTVIQGMTFDGAAKDAMTKAIRDALIGFMSAMAESQAEATKIAQKAGIAHAKTTEPQKYRGAKPSFTSDQLNRALELAAGSELQPAAIGREVGLSRFTVMRMLKKPEAAREALAKWEGK